MQVTEVMKSPNICTPATTVRKAASMMRQFDTGVFVIVDDPASRKIVGIITDRDLVLRVLTDRDPDRVTVKECMTSDSLVVCKPEDEIEQVMEAMAKHLVRRVPVVGAGRKVEGIITDRDLIQHPDIDPVKLRSSLARMTASKVRKPSAADPMVSSFP